MSHMHILHAVNFNTSMQSPFGKTGEESREGGARGEWRDERKEGKGGKMITHSKKQVSE